MTASPEHSFAVLACGGSPFLDECIGSLRGQTVHSEIFIATGTPSALLEQIAARWSVPLKINDASQGIGSDWSFALRSAGTKYVTLAHQDDLYLPAYTASCLALMTRPSDCAVCFTNYRELINGRHRDVQAHLLVKQLMLLPFLVSPVMRAPRLTRFLLSIANPFCCPSGMYDREKLNNFAFSDDLAFDLDWDAWQRIAAAGRAFGYVNKKLMIHRIHAGSQTAACMGSGKRSAEDFLLLQRSWPRPLARALAALHAAGANMHAGDR